MQLYDHQEKEHWGVENAVTEANEKAEAEDIKKREDQEQLDKLVKEIRDRQKEKSYSVEDERHIENPYLKEEGKEEFKE